MSAAADAGVEAFKQLWDALQGAISVAIAGGKQMLPYAKPLLNVAKSLGVTAALAGMASKFAFSHSMFVCYEE